MSADRRSWPARVLLAVVGFYSRAISPALPPRCRFTPTCSAYAAEAVAEHGAARGGWLALRRLAKCAPWHRGGVDLVPPARGGTSGSSRSSGTAVPASPPATRTGPVRRGPISPPATGRSAQQEVRVA